mmetsp:Transcript_15356/g.25602  ORF Transcript_15356/g.25602 Transcript_15356/m.25602 type:complete len:404 (-) Transcript_15356:928-2139(-)
MTGELRNRRNKQDKQAVKKPEETETKNDHQPPVPPPDAEPTMWSTFLSHPLVRMLPVIIIPYFCYRAYYFLRLQHPEYLGGMFRPAVALTQERQLLVVGSLASGTVVSAASLNDMFQLEVARDASDTMWHFARDGTASWFHGIRFMERPSDKEIFEFCMNQKAPKAGFHPTMYRSTSNCNERDDWNNCWARECITLLDQEWGCGLAVQKCETPFRTTLHQVRHPLRTVESLVTSHICVDGMESKVRPAFVVLLKLMVPSLETTDTCIEVAVKYVLAYTRAMLSAREQGFIAAMYQMEQATPCQLADLAGFANPETAVYGPNYEKIDSVCSQPFSPGKEVIGISEKTQINAEVALPLEWSDLRGGMHGSKRTDNDLETALRELTIELGYDPDQQRIKAPAGETY